MFQIGLVEWPGRVAEPDHLVAAAITKVARGGPLSPAEEDCLTFGDLDKL
jgi:hypothetical protein